MSSPEDPVTNQSAPIPEELGSNRFLFVNVASLRAKQLRRGALPRLGGSQVSEAGEHRSEAPHKPERVAMEEVRQGIIQFELPKPAKSSGLP